MGRYQYFRAGGLRISQLLAGSTLAQDPMRLPGNWGVSKPGCLKGQWSWSLRGSQYRGLPGAAQPLGVLSSFAGMPDTVDGCEIRFSHRDEALEGVDFPT